MKKGLPRGEAFFVYSHLSNIVITKTAGAHFGGAGVNISRLRPGSGFGFGLGAFFTSFLPLSLFPMHDRMPQNGGH